MVATIVRKSSLPLTKCKTHTDFDLDSPDRFRTYRGKYPREGYISGITDPFATPKDLRKAPPLRGC